MSLSATTAADLQKARALLETEQHAIVFVRGGLVLGVGDRRGVIDLLNLAETVGPDAAGAAVADRVVGRAAALVYCHLGVAAIYAQRLSEGGAAALEQGAVHAEWSERVEVILNRARDGICPFERAAATVDDPAEAIPVLAARLAQLMGSR
jgi:hypothetical protein